MDKKIITFTPEMEIPEFLRSEIRSKLAYIDEQVVSSEISPSNEIVLCIKKEMTDDESKRIIAKTQRLVSGIVKDAFKPKVKLLEDHLDRKVPFIHDPMDELLKEGEVSRELEGVYALGPLVTKLINYFETTFLELASEYEAIPYKFPTLIPAKYLERVNYFKAFPHSLSFATHLRSDLDIIQDFSQHAHCDGNSLTAPMSSFSQIETLLSPAVCYHLYFALLINHFLMIIS